MRKLLFLLLSALLLSMTSCRKDFEFEPSNGELRFSKDTIYLDTVFTNIGSSTYTLKVYNKSNKDILIPNIQLGKGAQSKYRMTVDGMRGDNGKIFKLEDDAIDKYLQTNKITKVNNSYDYLLGMPIYQLTYEKIEELKKLEKNKQDEYDNLYKMKPHDIWREELIELKDALNKLHNTNDFN